MLSPRFGFVWDPTGNAADHPDRLRLYTRTAILWRMRTTRELAVRQQPPVRGPELMPGQQAGTAARSTSSIRGAPRPAVTRGARRQLTSRRAVNLRTRYPFPLKGGYVSLPTTRAQCDRTIHVSYQAAVDDRCSSNHYPATSSATSGSAASPRTSGSHIPATAKP